VLFYGRDEGLEELWWDGWAVHVLPQSGYQTGMAARPFFACLFSSLLTQRLPRFVMVCSICRGRAKWGYVITHAWEDWEERRCLQGLHDGLPAVGIKTLNKFILLHVGCGNQSGAINMQYRLHHT